MGRVWLGGGGGESKVVVEECKMLINEIVVVVGVIVCGGVVVHVSAVVREAVRTLTDGSHHKHLLVTDEVRLS